MKPSMRTHYRHTRNIFADIDAPAFHRDKTERKARILPEVDDQSAKTRNILWINKTLLTKIQGKSSTELAKTLLCKYYPTLFGFWKNQIYHK